MAVISPNPNAPPVMLEFATFTVPAKLLQIAFPLLDRVIILGQEFTDKMPVDVL
jgi:hypothetical protein